MNGAISPDPQTPAAAVIPMALRLPYNFNYGYWRDLVKKGFIGFAIFIK